MPEITIDTERCRKDGLCVLVCPKVFEGKGGAVPFVARPELCNGCGHCLLICQSGAITHSDCSPGSLHAMRKNHLPAYEEVQEMLVNRRSIRNFRDTAVERKVLEKVIDAARYAPSAKNTQSTKYIVIEDRDLLRTMATGTSKWLEFTARRLKNPLWGALYRLTTGADPKEIRKWTMQFELIAERMRTGKDMVLYNAPVVVLFYAGRHIRFAEANANLAVQNATMAACSLGLGSFYTGYLVLALARNRDLRRLIALPKGHTVFGGLAMGYPAISFSRWIERRPPEVTWI